MNWKENKGFLLENRRDSKRVWRKEREGETVIKMWTQN